MNYTIYDNKKMGLFSVMKADAKYLLPGGWEQEIEQVEIIGEDSISYIYRLNNSEDSNWIGDQVITKNIIVPVGIHKSRLVKWLPVQLQFFK